MKKITFLLFCLLPFWAFSQPSFEIDADIPETQLNDATELTVLNARYGSRFSFSFAPADAAMHTGALGYDFDDLSELLIQIQSAKGEKYCFRTAAPPPGTQYLKNQTLRVGMTATQLTGETDDGLQITATIVSPFTPSESLEDTTRLKVQIVPAYYLLIDVKNTSGKKVKATVRIGIDKLPTYKNSPFAARSWAFGSNSHQMYFRDNSSKDTKEVVAAQSFKGQKMVREKGFTCLESQIEIPKKQTYRDTLIYALHFDGCFVRDNKYNLDTRFYYTKFWKNTDHVLAYARQNAQNNIRLSQKFEKILSRSNASPKEKWLIAIAFHSDIANSLLLTDDTDHARFLLVEGRFRHMSTIDVAHETELMAVFSPWRLKLQLEMWMDYMARKEVYVGLSRYGEPHYEGMSASEYGPFLYHDVGDLPHNSKTSDYSFGPHMAIEENSNYPLLLYWYWKLTGDDEFVKSQLGMLDVLLYSMTNRDTDGNGLADKGVGWSTYDMGDVIKRSPENVYLGVKQMCAYVAAAEMFENLPEKGKTEAMRDKEGVEDGTGIGFQAAQLNNEALRAKQAKKYRAEAQKIVQTLKKANQKHRYLPASLDQNFPNWDSYSIVLGEGLLLMGLSGSESELLKEIAPVLASNYETAFEKCKLPHAIALASKAEGSSWFSKVIAQEIVASYWFGKDISTAHYAYEWNKNNYFAYNDGVKKSGDAPWIGFWYPRGVIALGYLFRERHFTAKDRKNFLKEIR